MLEVRRPRPRRRRLALLLVLLAACSSDGADPTVGSAPTARAAGETATASSCLGSPAGNRVDIAATGNRVSNLQIDLAAADVVDRDLPGEPAWVLAVEGGWYVALADGTAVIVDHDGEQRTAPAVPGTPSIDGRGAPASMQDDLAAFDDPLPDARVAFGGPEARNAVTLTQPTDRYGHGVLGDRIEAASITILDRCDGSSTTIELAERDVVEGLGVIIADVDDDGSDDIVATVSNADEGARLVSWRLDGTLLAESAPIGRGNRWRNQLAVAAVGPDGETEVIDVRTPHIGGTVEYFRVVGDELVRVASSSADYTTHAIGSRNLELGIVIDADADGDPDVVVLGRDRTGIVAFDRVGDGVRIVASAPLDGLAVTNLAPDPESGMLAVGTRDGRLRVFNTP